MATPTDESLNDISTGKVLGLCLAFDFLMKNGFVEAAKELSFRIEMADGIGVFWDDEESFTVIEDPLTQDQFKLTDKAFM